MARSVWIGILVLYAVAVFIVIVLDIALHWGLIVGLKILAVIHILFVFGVVASFFTKRKQD
jgi:uncharacterized membrane protein YoaK (UPF0700 family)